MESRTKFAKLKKWDVLWKLAVKPWKSLNLKFENLVGFCMPGGNALLGVDISGLDGQNELSILTQDKVF